MRIDGKELLAFRIQRELLVGTLKVELSERLSTPQFQEDILRERNWILRDVKLGVDSNDIITKRTCSSICLRGMNHWGSPFTEFHPFDNSL